MTMVRRLARAALLFLVSALPALAQGTVGPVAKQQFLDGNGNPLANGRLYVYQSGTTTPATIYTDASLLVPALNAAVCSCSNLDASGRITYFLGPATYRFVLKTSVDVLVWDVDGVSSVAPFNVNLDITGTAGEALTTGQVVYLSDGSGGKNAGQWYKADNTLVYSSRLPEIGMVPASIANGDSGSIRLGGRMTGLAGLTIGMTYYVGTNGGLTSTAPTILRKLGVADSTATLILTSNPALGVSTWVDDFRLTVSTGTCVPASDVTAATTIYLSPCTGNRLDLPDSDGNPTRVTSTQFSIAVPATTNTTYDVFAFNNVGVATLELLAWRNSGQAITGATNATPIVVTANSHGLSNGDEVYVSGVAGNTAANGTWTVANVTTNTFELSTSVGSGAYTAATGYLNARATKVARTTNGRYLKSGDNTRLYVGSVRTTGSSGQTEDSAAKRYVWNYYNRARRNLLRQETTVSWPYSTATIRQGNGAAANQVDVVVGIGETSIAITLDTMVSNSAGAIYVANSIGEDSTTAITPGVVGGGTGIAGAGEFYALHASLFKMPGAGRHFYTWLEFSDPTITTTWFGTWVGSGHITTAAGAFGLSGWIEG